MGGFILRSILVIFLMRWSYLNAEQNHNFNLFECLECLKVTIFECCSSSGSGSDDGFINYWRVAINVAIWIIHQCFHFIQAWLPRLAASMLTSFLGICFGYVGLLHMKLIHTK